MGKSQADVEELLAKPIEELIALHGECLDREGEIEGGKWQAMQEIVRRIIARLDLLEEKQRRTWEMLMEALTDPFLTLGKAGTPKEESDG